MRLVGHWHFTKACSQEGETFVSSQVNKVRILKKLSPDWQMLWTAPPAVTLIQHNLISIPVYLLAKFASGKVSLVCFNAFTQLKHWLCCVIIQDGSFQLRPQTIPFTRPLTVKIMDLSLFRTSLSFLARWHLVCFTSLTGLLPTLIDGWVVDECPRIEQEHWKESETEDLFLMHRTKNQ